MGALKGIFLLGTVALLVACGGSDSGEEGRSSPKILYFGGIPDQDAARLA